MAWLEKTETTSFENDPIDGLFFLHGSLIAAVVGRDWTIDQKYPLIAFPSGLEFDLWEGSQSPIIHILQLHRVVKRIKALRELEMQY